MDRFWGLGKKTGSKPQLIQLQKRFNDAYRSDYPNFQRTKMKDKAETTVALRGMWVPHTHKHYYYLWRKIYIFMVTWQKSRFSRDLHKRNKESHPKKAPYSFKILNTINQIYSISWKNSWHHWLNTISLKVPPSVPCKFQTYDLGSIVSSVKFIWEKQKIKPKIKQKNHKPTNSQVLSMQVKIHAYTLIKHLKYDSSKKLRQGLWKILVRVHHAAKPVVCNWKFIFFYRVTKEKKKSLPKNPILLLLKP